MTTTEKLQGNELNVELRELINLYKEVSEAVNNKPWTDVCNNICKTWGTTYTILTENDIKVDYTHRPDYSDKEYKLSVHVHKYFGDTDGAPDKSLVTVFDSSIDDTTYDIEWAQRHLGHDFTEKEQIEFFETWDLTPLERFMSKDLGVTVYLLKDIVKKNKVCCYLHSTDLVEFSGICKAMFRHLTIESFGSCSFFFSNKDGLQHVSVPDMSFRYEHTGGGNNGHSIYYVGYDIRKGTWQVRKPDEDKAYELDNDGNITKEV